MMRTIFAIAIFVVTTINAGVCPDERDPGCCLQFYPVKQSDGTTVNKPLGYDAEKNQCTFPVGFDQNQESSMTSSLISTSTVTTTTIVTPSVSTTETTTTETSTSQAETNTLGATTTQILIPPVPTMPTNTSMPVNSSETTTVMSTTTTMSNEVPATPTNVVTVITTTSESISVISTTVVLQPVDIVSNAGVDSMVTLTTTVSAGYTVPTGVSISVLQQESDGSKVVEMVGPLSNVTRSDNSNSGESFKPAMALLVTTLVGLVAFLN